MATITLDFTGIADTNPYSPPSDWLSVGQVAARIFGSAWTSTGSTNTIWIYNKAPTGILTSEITIGTINSSDSRGIAFCDNSGNGYVLLVRSIDARLFKVAAGVLGTQVGGTYSGTFALNDGVKGTLDTATGGFIFYKNNVQFTTFTDTTYSTGLRAGLMSRAGGGYIKSVSVSDYVVQAITSINGGSPITSSQSAVAAITTGFTGLPTTITTNATGVTCGTISGTTNAPTWVQTVRTDGAVFSKSGTVVTYTFTNGAETANGDQTINKDADQTAVIVSSPINDDTTCLFGAIFATTGRSAANGDEVYHTVPAGMSDLVVNPDGTMEVTNAGTFTCWVWTIATGVNYYYSVTITENGVVIGGGLTSSGLTSSGLTIAGLISSGL